MMISQASVIKLIPTNVHKSLLMKKTTKAMMTEETAMSLTRVPIVTPTPFSVLSPPKVHQVHQKTRKRNISKKLKPKVQSRNLKTNNPPQLIPLLIQFHRNRPKLTYTKLECLN
uniref:(northern house mosquito) hypothetical protein n=1 Tax=Culex pipiens TaxID=7175 RepID=A0A8D8IRB1_CULPI